jgi:flagellar biosynthesis/type III secretory pathway M-ring protein FliF/YscJ
MDMASAFYLGVTFLLVVIFALIFVRTYSRKRKEKAEAPKYRMMDDEGPAEGRKPNRKHDAET